MGSKQTTEERKAMFLEALRRRLGIVATACNDVGMERKTYYRWRDSDEAFRAKVDDILETQVDYVETALIQRIKDGDTTAIIFYLKTKGRKRGYGESDRARDTAIKINVVEE